MIKMVQRHKPRFGAVRTELEHVNEDAVVFIDDKKFRITEVEVNAVDNAVIVHTEDR